MLPKRTRRSGTKVKKCYKLLHIMENTGCLFVNIDVYRIRKNKSYPEPSAKLPRIPWLPSSLNCGHKWTSCNKEKCFSITVKLSFTFDVRTHHSSKNHQQIMSNCKSLNFIQLSHVLKVYKPETKWKLLQKVKRILLVCKFWVEYFKTLFFIVLLKFDSVTLSIVWPNSVTR